MEQVKSTSTAWELHTIESFEKQMDTLLKRTQQEYNKEDARRNNSLDDGANAVPTSRTAEAEFVKLKVDARFKQIEQEVKSLTAGGCWICGPPQLRALSNEAFSEEEWVGGRHELVSNRLLAHKVRYTSRSFFFLSNSAGPTTRREI
jgi:hypothetical protein